MHPDLVRPAGAGHRFEQAIFGVALKDMEMRFRGLALAMVDHGTVTVAYVDP